MKEKKRSYPRKAKTEAESHFVSILASVLLAALIFIAGVFFGHQVTECEDTFTLKVPPPPVAGSWGKNL